jgi:polar amino acid transport system substrate-binding protein
VSPAQEPPISAELLDRRLRLDGERITICIYPKDLTAEFDRAVATAVAETLLLEPVFYEIDVPVEVEIMDRLPIDLDDLFILMTNTCDAIVGRTLLPQTWPDWLIFSRPYYYSPFVLLVTDPKYQSLADIPASAAVGTRLGTRADTNVIVYRQALSPADRWTRVPYIFDEDLLLWLIEGTVAAAFIWEPALLELSQGRPERLGLRRISPDPMQAPEFAVAIAFGQRSIYTRTLFDEAIVALIESGQMAELLEQTNTPGRPASPGRY